MPSRSVRLLAPAKLNLHLGVFPERDERGYHRVDSVMTYVDVFDTVTVTEKPAGGPVVETVPAADFPMEDNTAYKALVGMAELAGRPAAAHAVIEKGIPSQAGLGGASADAAAVILGLCELWGLDAADDKVAALARSIGADVPFFLYDKPCYLAGAGDVMAERFEPLAGVPVALVKPPLDGITARAAYVRFDEMEPAAAAVEPMLRALRAGDVDAMCRALFNSLEPVALDLVPKLGSLLGWLRAQDGVREAQVTGSGSCTFAVCETAADAERVAGVARERGLWAVASAMSARGVRFAG